MHYSNYKLLGHRGARATLLENTEIGFAYAQNLRLHHHQLDGVEFDIQMTLDGQFVVVHDETLTRLTGQQSWVADMNLSDITTIQQSDYLRYQNDFDSGFLNQRVLSFESIYPYLTNFQHIELEIKTHKKTNAQVLVQHLLRLLSDAPYLELPFTLTSFDTDILYQLQNQQSTLPIKQRYPTGLLLEPKTTLASQIAFLPTLDSKGQALIYQTFNLAKELGCCQVGIYFALITPKLVEIAKRFDLMVTAWTVNDVTTAKKLINIGVDCVITDYPSLMLKQLKLG